MKTKKLFVSILAVAVLAIAVYSVVSSIAQKPTVTEGEFPFSITYELDGESVTISDVYKARYVRNGGYADTKSRIYVGEIGNMGEGNTYYTLKQDENGISVKQRTKFKTMEILSTLLYCKSFSFFTKIRITTKANTAINTVGNTIAPLK